MFDIAFFELMVIAVVALVVIGPEKLPTVARTVGALLGRMNRYVNDVKADVQREMRIEEMKKFQDEIENQVSSVERTVSKEMSAVQRALEFTGNSSQAPLAGVFGDVREAPEGKPSHTEALDGVEAPIKDGEISSSDGVVPVSPPPSGETKV